ncbi:FAD-binding oxidoreductase [Methylocystis echinoides]|uniref:FAD-binding oxidoreductase n=1 Tax=Methylocystis echinoides TaxID=29468 RepID=UPI00343C7640
MSSPPLIDRDDYCSWGRVVRRRQRVVRPHFFSELPGLVGLPSSKLAIGRRRSYGDSCLNSDGSLIDMCGLDRFISFDAKKGVLRAEAGVVLSDILHLTVPSGWFLPTTPGTRFVTLGGAVANDVHGKNHHSAGSIGRHVRAIGLLRSDRGRLTVTPASEVALYSATIGGLGLTGVIEWVELDLARIAAAHVDVECLPFENLEEFWALSAESVGNFEHTVAWIDCVSKGSKIGRGIFTRGNWSTTGSLIPHKDETWKTVPIEAPSSLLNTRSIGAFNEVYYHLQKRKRKSRLHYAPFFYPLDSVLHWNRLYGRSGMLQYQCVIPKGEARRAIPHMLSEITRSGGASFLAVLKTFGALASPGLLSFPREGATLAIDFPNRGRDTLEALARLDQIVQEFHGALYPAKDGRMPARLFRQSFPGWEEFSKATDPAMSSDFWRRVAS